MSAGKIKKLFDADCADFYRFSNPFHPHDPCQQFLFPIQILLDPPVFICARSRLVKSQTKADTPQILLKVALKNYKKY